MIKVFILGNPRSGTSLFRLMLQQHDAIVAPPEGGFAHWLLPKYGKWTASDSANEQKVEAFVYDVLVSKKMETWDLSKSLLKSLIARHSPGSYGALVALVYLAYKHPDPIEVIVDKNNYYIHHLDELQHIWPEARFIHLVRDGRDVACSYTRVAAIHTASPYRPNLPKEIPEIAKEWQQNNKKIVAFLAHQNSPHCIIKYEDLVTSPKESLTSICSFLQLPFQDKMLGYYTERGSKYQEPNATLDWKRTTRNSLDISRLGSYKTEMSANQLSVFNSRAQEMLTYFNYE